MRRLMELAGRRWPRLGASAAEPAHRGTKDAMTMAAKTAPPLPAAEPALAPQGQTVPPAGAAPAGPGVPAARDATGIADAGAGPAPHRGRVDPRADAVADADPDVAAAADTDADPYATDPAQQIWDMDLGLDEAETRPDPVADPPPVTRGLAAPATERACRQPADADTAPPPPRGGRPKTRILGFHAGALDPDPMAGPIRSPAAQAQFPAGWLVVVDGPGRGCAFTVSAGVSTIGRDADQSISLDHGDQSISRHNHASVAYDDEQNKFFIGHGGKSNVVRRNGDPVLSTEELSDGDRIRIGRTTLRFVALCTADFTWHTAEDGDDG